MKPMVMLVAMLIGASACGVDDSTQEREEPTCKELGCTFFDCTDFGGEECACDLFVDGKVEQVMCLRTDEPAL